MEKLNKKRKITETPVDSNPEIRKEFIRLISQALKDFGYMKSAEHLEQESGIPLEIPEVKSFRDAILQGDWDKVSEIIPNFSIPNQNKQKVKLYVKQQKYLEQIMSGDYETALYTLRKELAPIHDESENLHTLASLLLCSGAEELKQNSELELDRTKILKKVQTYIPASVMLPNSRLLVLASQAMEYQVNSCEKHCGFFKSESLLEDHSCDFFSVPKNPLSSFSENNEVWEVILSHGCDKVIAICKSSTMTVWDLSSHIKVFSVAVDASSACWSLNDQMIVTGSNTGKIVSWTAAGMQTEVYNEHEDKVLGVKFLTNSVLLTGGVDRKLLVWENFVKTKMIEFRVRQIEKSSASNTVAVLNAAKNEIYAYSYMPFEKIATITEDDIITSMQINMTGSHVLTAVSLTNPVISKQRLNLWTLNGSLIQSFEGFAQEKFILRPCFAGPSEDLVLIGSENGEIHIWSKLHGSHLGKIEGHTGTVSCLVMNSKETSSVISCGDDGMIKIWNLDPSKRE